MSNHIVSFLAIAKWALDFLINHLFFHHRKFHLQETCEEHGIKWFNGRKPASYDEEVECAVCLNKIEDDDETRELRCNHHFHKTCLDSWLAHRHTTCPLCRDNLMLSPKINYDYSFCNMVIF